MPAHAITRRRERRLLALIEAGASISEASRATQVSRTTVYRHTRADTTFAHRLDRARVRVAGPPVEDWRTAAAFLEREHPEQWALRDAPFDLSAD
jgi:hypothetical protein